MRHCIVMTAYKDVEQINRFVESAPENFDFYIHTDKKSTIDQAQISKRAKVFCEYKIYWGAVEHLKAFLFLLKQAYESGVKYDFFHLCTGQDFFACRFTEFDSLLKPDTCYIELIRLPRKGWWHGGYFILKYRTLASLFDVRDIFARCANWLYLSLQRLFMIRRSVPAYAMGCGSVYCTIPRGGVKQCLYSDISKDLLNRLENTTCSEELFFQTVLLNSEYKDKIVTNNMRYIDWSANPAPKFLDADDFEKIVKSKVLFCRKVDSRISATLLSKLVEYIKK